MQVALCLLHIRLTEQTTRTFYAFHDHQELCVIKYCQEGYAPCGYDDGKVVEKQDINVKMRCCPVLKDVS